MKGLKNVFIVFLIALLVCPMAVKALPVQSTPSYATVLLDDEQLTKEDYEEKNAKLCTICIILDVIIIICICALVVRLIRLKREKEEHDKK